MARNTCCRRSLPPRSLPYRAVVLAPKRQFQAKLICRNQRPCRPIHTHSFSVPLASLETEREAAPPFRASFRSFVLRPGHLSNSANVHKETPVGRLLRLGSPPRCE